MTELEFLDAVVHAFPHVAWEYKQPCLVGALEGTQTIVFQLSEHRTNMSLALRKLGQLVIQRTSVISHAQALLPGVLWVKKDRFWEGHWKGNEVIRMCIHSAESLEIFGMTRGGSDLSSFYIYRDSFGIFYGNDVIKKRLLPFKILQAELEHAFPEIFSELECFRNNSFLIIGKNGAQLKVTMVDDSFDIDVTTSSYSNVSSFEFDPMNPERTIDNIRHELVKSGFMLSKDDEPLLAKDMTTEGIANERRSNMSDDKSRVGKMIAVATPDVTEAAWRTAGSQFIKLAREPLVGLLTRHLAPNDDAFRARLAAFLETELGAALLASVLSASLSTLPQATGEIPQKLSRELRVRAMSDAGDVMADVLLGPLRQVMALYLQDPAGIPSSIPSLDEPKPQEPDILGLRSVKEKV